MKIGLDLDFTITTVPEFFAVISKALMDVGHEVHVITFRDASSREETRRELVEMGINFSGLHLPSDTVSSAPDWKAEVAKDIGLDIMFEDSPENLAAMPDGVINFLVCDPFVVDLEKVIGSLRTS
jgi:hypothetical protein